MDLPRKSASQPPAGSEKSAAGNANANLEKSPPIPKEE